MKRIGVIGLGAMGTDHIKTLNEIKGWKLTAVSDSNSNRESELREAKILDSSTIFFSDYRELMKSGLCDCVAIVTPHPFHPEMVVEAFDNSLHVMCDKPIATTVSEADRMIHRWKESNSLFSTMYSIRCRPSSKLIREWVASGRLGNIIRVEMSCTKWLRTQSYFDSQSWRGTWQGEDGGLLMNQAPHNLDLLYLWFGPAKSINAKIRTRFHDIETEDEVSAIIETQTGFPIQFYASTGEAPGKDYLEIVGSKGTLIKEDENLLFKHLAKDLQNTIMNSEERMPIMEYETEKIELPEAKKGHYSVFENILESLETGVALISPGNEGIHSVEMANAMLLSSFLDKTVELPIDRDEYNRLLEDLKSGRKKLKKKKEVKK
jgi:predicted dehydrogenase